MENFTFQLIFEHARAAFFHRPGMGQRGDLPGAAHHGKLFRGFKQAHLMHNGPPVDNRVRRLQILARAFAQFFEGVEHNLIGIGIFTLGEVDRVQTVEQLIQLLVDFAERQRPVDAKLRRRGLLAQTASKPDLSGKIANPVEQHAMVVGFIAFNQHQQRFRFVKAGEVPEIAVLPVGIFRICTAHRFRCGENQRRAAWLHLRQQRLATR